MKTLAKNGNHHEEVKIIKREGSLLQVAIGNREYTLDVEKVEEGVYSVLHNGTSHNLEIIKSEKKQFYAVNSQFFSFDIEIAAESPVKGNSKKHQKKSETITAPIPGKVISVKARPGQEVKEGQTLVVLSAMKMENELKAPIDGVVNQIYVKEDDVVKDSAKILEIKTAES